MNLTLNVKSGLDTFFSKAFNPSFLVSESAFAREIQGVRQLVKTVANAQNYPSTDGAGKSDHMTRVKDGLNAALSVAAVGPRVAVAGAKFVGGKINGLAAKRPVLAMSAGIAGAVLGGVLCSVEPFTGIALTSTAAYTIAKSYKNAMANLKAKAENSGPNMKRVYNGLRTALSVAAAGPRVAVAGAKFVGGKINTLAEKNPVLAMSLGLAGVVLGAALWSVEPFTGIALTATSVYAMARGFKKAWGELSSAKNSHADTASTPETDHSNNARADTDTVVSDVEQNDDSTGSGLDNPQPALIEAVVSPKTDKLEQADATENKADVDMASAPETDHSNNASSVSQKVTEDAIESNHEENKKIMNLEELHDTVRAKLSRQRATAKFGKRYVAGDFARQTSARKLV